MKKFLMMLVTMALPVAGFAQDDEVEIPVNDVVITDNVAGQLKEALVPHKPATITGLKITGEINGTDVAEIRSLCSGSEGELTVLHKLDLSEARIVEGGEPYFIDDGYGSTGEEMHTQNDVVGKFMFYSCAYLDTLLIPQTTVEIGKEAFHGLRKLKSFEIPKEVKAIGEGAFIDCNVLKTIAFPDAITKLEPRVMARCYELETVVYPAKLKVIGDGAFMSCYALKEINIPATTDSLGMGAFLACEGARKIVIPEGMKTISKFAFGRCEVMEEVYCYATVPPTCPAEAFNDVPVSTCMLYVPKGSMEAYKTSVGFQQFPNVEEMKNIETLVLDAEDYNNTYDLEQNLNKTMTVQIKRPVKAGEWDSFCFPFKLDEAGLKKVFGDGVVVKAFDRYGNPEAGENEFSIVMKDVKEVAPGHPYLLKTSVSADVLTFENVTIETSTTAPLEVAWGSDVFVFRGSFSKNDMLGTEAWFVDKSGKLYMAPYYAEDLQEYWVSGFCAYFLLPHEWIDQNVELLLEGVVNGIDLLDQTNAALSGKTGSIYTIDGCRVNGSADRLPKGLYIIDGKKVVVE
ncbi:MAG: leucine-rich repeat domain-containing protein [Prevotella sp.]|nr:leucine-rich repeat domain-containing protein [Prevotella sp.]